MGAPSAVDDRPEISGQRFPLTIPDRRTIAKAQAEETPAAIVCGDCWEPVEFVRPAEGERLELVAGRSSGWKHVRTGHSACEPLCDVCHAGRGTTALGRREYDGANIRFINRAFVCDVCVVEVRHQAVAIEEFVR